MNPFETTADPGVCILAAKHFRRQAQRLAAQLDGIRAAEDVECVHRARVASRRLRAGLRMFQAYLTPKAYARWRKHVRRITSGLGDARDKDVQIEFLCRVLCEMNEASLFPGVARLLAQLEKHRERLQPKVVKAVARIERSGVLDEMQASVKEVQDTYGEAKPSPRSAAVFREAEQRINTQLDELFSHENGLADPLATAAHHAMRIAAKRLRYTLEIVKSPYQGTLDEMIEVTKQVQTLLGDIHDCDIWAERLAAFAQQQRNRVVDRFGQEGPYARLAAGINCLQDARARDRERLFGELVDYWTERKRARTWDALRCLARARGAPALAAAQPEGCPEDAGHPTGGAAWSRGRSAEARLAACAPRRED